MSKTLFIADLHLTVENSEKSDRFVQFLKDKASTTQALYILGDCFDLWLGDDVECPRYKIVLEALRQWTEQIPCYFMPGNHDFLIGSRFYRESGVQILTDPTYIKLHETVYLLTHGDRFCNCQSYLRFRSWAQSKIIRYIFLKLPLKYRQRIAYWLQKHSRQLDRYNSGRIVDLSLKQLKAHPAFLRAKLCIHGHTHAGKVYFQEDPDGCIERYALGDWGEEGSYLAIDEDEVTLEVYSVKHGSV